MSPPSWATRGADAGIEEFLDLAHGGVGVVGVGRRDLDLRADGGVAGKEVLHDGTQHGRAS